MKSIIKLTQRTVSDPCIKKSIDVIIIVDPTMLDEAIVMNLTHNNVVTANIMAPPPTATTISRSYEENQDKVSYNNIQIM